jgi:hypothetical protein
MIAKSIDARFVMACNVFIIGVFFSMMLVSKKTKTLRVS